jgi:hypothetical protein
MAAHRVTNVAIQQSLEQSKKKKKKKKKLGCKFEWNYIFKLYFFSLKF